MVSGLWQLMGWELVLGGRNNFDMLGLGRVGNAKLGCAFAEEVNSRFK